jgi:transposase
LKSKCRKPRVKGAKTAKSDLEARFGYQKWGKECFFGYKSMILASSEPLIVPLAWQVIPANQQEVNHLIPIVSQAAWLLEKDKDYELIGDSGFDAGYNYDWCKQLKIRLTCPLNMANKLKGERLKKWKFYKSKLGQKLYQRRTDIERLNGHLKDLFLIDPFPVRRLKNVNTYLNLVMLCYLAGVYYNNRLRIVS